MRAKELADAGYDDSGYPSYAESGWYPAGEVS
jgi:hypothetical protein